MKFPPRSGPFPATILVDRHGLRIWLTEICNLRYFSHLFLYTVQLAVRRIIAVCSNNLIWIVFKETVHASDLSRNSSVGIATRLGAALPRNLCSNSGSVTNFICSPERSDRLLASPSILCSGYRGSLSPVVKRPGRETAQPDLMPRLRISGVYATSPPWPFMACKGWDVLHLFRPLRNTMRLHCEESR